ncbi:MAG: tetratricopeptide repeat protein, partial [Sphingomonadaceae bacterium]
MTPVLAALLLSTASLAEDHVASTTPPEQPPARILPLDPRMEVYDQFRAFFETQRYQDALLYAQRVVELSEADPSRDYELPIAYNNLGATQYQLGEYAAAEQSYKKSLEILEISQGISSRRLIVPLAGLGAVYAALDQHAMATEKLERALAVSRRSEGLFNLTQLPLIEQIAASRFAIGDLQGVESERYYALRIAEQNYGYGDPRTVPPAMRLAKFYEELQEYGPARGLYLRVRDIAMAESGGFSPLAVRTLISICRTHRMQYTMEPDSIDDDEPVRDPVTGQLVGRVYRTTRVPGPQADRAGLKSAEMALEILRATRDPPADLLLETLTELGDWYQATGRPSRAMAYYAEVSSIHAQHPDSGLVNPLLAPRLIFYRAP